VAARDWTGKAGDKDGERMRRRLRWRGGGEGACTDAGVKGFGGGGSGTEKTEETSRGGRGIGGRQGPICDLQKLQGSESKTKITHCYRVQMKK
jgi:hypothetical protein